MPARLGGNQVSQNNFENVNFVFVLLYIVLFYFTYYICYNKDKILFNKGENPDKVLLNILRPDENWKEISQIIKTFSHTLSVTVVLDGVIIDDWNCMFAPLHSHGPDGVPELLLLVIFQYMVQYSRDAIAPCIE